jgi:phage baseplate assembly protein W
MASILTSLGKVAEVYSDIPNSFASSPVDADLTRVVNEQAIKQSIRNLLLTDRGERLFRPNLGSDIKALLFENATPVTLKLAESHIKELITLNEKRCNLISCTVSSNLDTNYVEITILFNVINRTETVEFNIILDRVR